METIEPNTKQMNLQKLFDKYHINESHGVWESIDDWMSVEIYRIMHDGKLPLSGDTSVDWITRFLDKVNTDIEFFKKLKQR